MAADRDGCLGGRGRVATWRVGAGGVPPVALVTVAVLAAALLVPASARAADALPTSCGQATLAGGPSDAKPHSDGTFTPVLLVHGFHSGPAWWSSPVDHSARHDTVKTTSSLVDGLRRLPGAAVYTLDYSRVKDVWFTEPGAGGQIFVDAMDCLMGKLAVGDLW